MEDLLQPALDGWRLPCAQQLAIAAAYAEPARAYHNLSHVQELLQHFRDIAAGPGWQHPREVYLALCYHDAIYLPARADNEARSADLASAQIAQHLPDSGINVARVAELIRFTAKHGGLNREGLDDEARLFLDVDMAILGADADAFDRYDAAVAEEYRPVVPAFIYRHKRKQFLRLLLDAPRIFLSDYGHARWDVPARANLRRVLRLS
jgi:predicted metal-dependent HD superfamily phosphohydrolase